MQKVAVPQPSIVVAQNGIALEPGETYSLAYTDQNNHLTARVVRVIEFIDMDHVRCFCFMRKAPRTLHVSEMVNPTRIDKAYGDAMWREVQLLPEAQVRVETAQVPSVWRDIDVKLEEDDDPESTITGRVTDAR